MKEFYDLLAENVMSEGIFFGLPKFVVCAAES